MTIPRTKTLPRLFWLSRLGVLLLLVLLARAVMYSPENQARANAAKAASSAPQPASDSKYVGSGICASCHQKVYQDFLRTGMGRSMVPVTSVLLQTAAVSAAVHDETLNRHFEGYA